MLNLNDISIRCENPNVVKKQPRPIKTAKPGLGKPKQQEKLRDAPDFSENYLIINNRLPARGETALRAEKPKPPTKNTALRATINKLSNQIEKASKESLLLKPSSSGGYRDEKKVENVFDFLKKYEFKFLKKDLPEFIRKPDNLLENNFFAEEAVERGDEALLTAKKPGKIVKMDDLLGNTPQVADAVLERPILSPIGVKKRLNYDGESFDRNYEESINIKRDDSVGIEQYQDDDSNIVADEDDDGFENIQSKDAISMTAGDNCLDASFEEVDVSIEDIGFEEEEQVAACESLPQTKPSNDAYMGESKLGDRILHELYLSKLTRKRQANDEIKLKVKQEMESIFSIFKAPHE